jgi:hypothetical protein
MHINIFIYLFMPDTAPLVTHTMDELIKVVNRLQDALSSVSLNNPIDLPQIVVIGRHYIIYLLTVVVSLVGRAPSWKTLWEGTFYRAVRA